MQQMKIGLQFAMPAELQALSEFAQAKPLEIISGVQFYEIEPNIIACAGGVGKVNAALAAEILCQRYDIDLILNSGVAGCLSDLSLGSAVVASEFIQHDVDTTAVGDPIGLVSTVKQSIFPAWQPQATAQILEKMGIKTTLGRIATGDWFASPGERASWINNNFSPLLIDMEACAIAQVCLRNNVKFISLKSVSDHPLRQGNSEEYFDFAAAIQEMGEILLPFTKQILKTSALVAP